MKIFSDPLVLSRLSLLISLIAPSFIALNYLRDRAVVTASSSLRWTSLLDKDYNEIEIPILFIKVSNYGRRSIYLAHLITRFPRGEKIREVKHPLIKDEIKPKVEEEEAETQKRFNEIIGRALDNIGDDGLPRLIVNEEEEKILRDNSEISSRKFRELRDFFSAVQNYSFPLNEGESFEASFRLRPPENIAFFYNPENENLAIELFVEDSLGRRYRVKNSKKVIKEICSIS